MFQVSPVVKQLLIINVIFFVVAYVLLPQLQFLLPLYYPTSEHFQPFQIVTNLFMHGNLNHLFFNMLSLFFLGPMLEFKLGPKKFLALYLSAGVAGVIGHILMIFLGQTSVAAVLGASGAIMGVLGAIAFYFPHQKIQLLFPPIPIKIGHLALILIAFDLFSNVAGQTDNIAHFAHLGGAFCGLALAYYFQKTDQSFRRF